MLEERFLELRARIEGAERAAHREVGSVHLLPVSKGQPPELVLEARRLGAEELGENYVQECRAKDLELRAGGEAVSWHLLGHLQGNKVRQAVALFSVVESLDSLELARRLSAANLGGSPIPVLLEVELTSMAQRTGFIPPGLELDLEQLLQLEGISIQGLMTVAAPGGGPAVFQRCRELRDRLQRLSGLALPTLSMGMSQDFEEAIAAGSTEVRIGTLLFGSRGRR